MPALLEVDLTRSFPRRFVPQDADMGEWTDSEPLFAELLRRNPASVAELERWLEDCSELFSAYSEERTKRYIAMTTQTDDPAREAAYEKFMTLAPPAPLPLTATGLGALAVNLTCALILTRFREHQGSLTRAAFLSARNDAIANIAIIAAGPVTAATSSGIPDLVVGLGIAWMNADAAREVWSAARQEHAAARA